MNIVQQFKYNNSNDYELIKRIRKQVIKLIEGKFSLFMSNKNKRELIDFMSE
jgi:predicted DNA-binding protein YlxM (UPF0122 family)